MKGIDVERELEQFFSEDLVPNIISLGRKRQNCLPMIYKYDEIMQCTSVDETVAQGKLSSKFILIIKWVVSLITLTIIFGLLIFKRK